MSEVYLRNRQKQSYWDRKSGGRGRRVRGETAEGEENRPAEAL